MYLNFLAKAVHEYTNKTLNVWKHVPVNSINESTNSSCLLQRIPISEGMYEGASTRKMAGNAWGNVQFFNSELEKRGRSRGRTRGELGVTEEQERISALDAVLCFRPDSGFYQVTKNSGTTHGGNGDLEYCRCTFPSHKIVAEKKRKEMERY